MTRTPDTEPLGGGRDPVAIVGAACRLPGAPGVAAYRELLLGGARESGEPPPGSATATATAGVGESPEAWHELFEQAVTDALADAGLRDHVPAGLRTGVYAVAPAEATEPVRRPRALAAPISRELRLRGPRVDLTEEGTNALLGVHLAGRALWADEADLALVVAGGPCGRRAGTYGTVAVVLKRLSHARRDGDRVYATVLGSALANARDDAAPTSGLRATLTAAYRDAGVPPGQVDYVELCRTGTAAGADRAELTVLAGVLRAGRPADHPCVVGSGTGDLGAAAGLAGLLKTALALRHRWIPAAGPAFDSTSDPASGPAADSVSGGVSGVASGPAADSASGLASGPVSGAASDSASGAASDSTSDSTSGAVSGPVPAGTPLEPALDPRPWPGDGPGLAGVGSSGPSGAGVQVVLGGPPPAARPEPPEAYLLPLSARDPEALQTLAGAYADALDAGPGAVPDPLDVCATAGAREARHDHRMAVVAGGGAELAAALRSPGDHPDAVAGGPRRAATTPRVVFVFPGQGAHWEGMARGLLRASPVFTRRLRECGRAVEAELGWSPADRLVEGGRLSAVDEVQPTVWAIQVALTEVWRDWGITPDAVIGHSMGEIAAATAAGALTIEDGAAVVCRRGRLIRERAVPGAMWAVQLTEAEAQEAIGEHADRVCAGVLNGETSIVLSGDPEALTEVTAPLLERGVFCRRVKVNYASHAPQVEPMRADLLAALSEVRPRPARVRMHSTAWDRLVEGTELDAAYWMENLRRPVRFGAAVRAMLTDRVPTVFVEVSAHPLLVKPVEESIAAAGGHAVAVTSLYRKRPDVASLLTGLGAAYAAGCDPDWSRVHEGGRVLTPPPSHAPGAVQVS